MIPSLLAQAESAATAAPSPTLPRAVWRWAASRRRRGGRAAAIQGDDAPPMALPTHLVGDALEVWAFLWGHGDVILPPGLMPGVGWAEFQTGLTTREPEDGFVGVVVGLAALALHRCGLGALVDLLGAATVPELARMCVSVVLGREVTSDMAAVTGSWHALELNPDSAFVEEGKRVLGSMGEGGGRVSPPAWVDVFVDLGLALEAGVTVDVNSWMRRLLDAGLPLSTSAAATIEVHALMDHLWRLAVHEYPVVGREFLLRCTAIVNRLRFSLNDWAWGADVHSALRAGYFGGSPSAFLTDVCKHLEDGRLAQALVKSWLVETAPCLPGHPQQHHYQNQQSIQPWTRWLRVRTRTEYETMCASCRGALPTRAKTNRIGARPTPMSVPLAVLPQPEECEVCALLVHNNVAEGSCLSARPVTPALTPGVVCMACDMLAKAREEFRNGTREEPSSSRAPHSSSSNNNNNNSNANNPSTVGILTPSTSGFPAEATKPSSSSTTLTTPVAVNSEDPALEYATRGLDDLVECLYFREMYDWTLNDRVALLLFLTRQAQTSDVIRARGDEALARAEEVRKELLAGKRARVGEWVSALRHNCGALAFLPELEPPPPPEFRFREDEDHTPMDDQTLNAEFQDLLNWDGASTVSSWSGTGSGSGDEGNAASGGEDEDARTIDDAACVGGEDDVVMQLAREEASNEAPVTKSLIASRPTRAVTRKRPTDEDDEQPVPGDKTSDGKGHDEGPHYPHRPRKGMRLMPRPPPVADPERTCAGCGHALDGDEERLSFHDVVAWACVVLRDPPPARWFCPPPPVQAEHLLPLHSACARVAERIAAARKKAVEPLLEPLANRLVALECDVVTRSLAPRLEPVGMSEVRAWYVFPGERDVVFSHSTTTTTTQEGVDLQAWRVHPISVAGDLLTDVTSQEYVMLVVRLLMGDMYARDEYDKDGVSPPPTLSWHFPPTPRVPGPLPTGFRRSGGNGTTTLAPDLAQEPYPVVATAHHEPFVVDDIALSPISRRLLSWAYGKAVSAPLRRCGFCSEGLETEGEMHCTWCHTTFQVSPFSSSSSSSSSASENDTAARHVARCLAGGCTAERAGFAVASLGVAPRLSPGTKAWAQLMALKRTLLELEAALPLTSTIRSRWTMETRGAWVLKVKACTTPSQLLCCVSVLEAVLNSRNAFEHVAATFRFPLAGGKRTRHVSVAYVATRVFGLDRALSWAGHIHAA